MKLSLITDLFVQHFGEMGGKWGLSRAASQIYALLYISGRRLPADDIVETLGFSRSSVSVGLKELQSWRLIRQHHQPGDRREYFSSPDDVLQILRIILEERRRREIEPTRALLRALLSELPDGEDDRNAQARLREMHELAELLAHWSEDVHGLSRKDLMIFLQSGRSAARLPELGTMPGEADAQDRPPRPAEGYPSPLGDTRVTRKSNPTITPSPAAKLTTP